jgi:hypothetical protein
MLLAKLTPDRVTYIAGILAAAARRHARGAGVVLDNECLCIGGRRPT